MKPITTKDVQIIITGVYEDAEQVYVVIQRRAFFKSGGWRNHGMPQRVELPVQMLLDDAVCNAVASEQYRQEKAAYRDEMNRLAESQPQLELPFM